MAERSPAWGRAAVVLSALSMTSLAAYSWGSGVEDAPGPSPLPTRGVAVVPVPVSAGELFPAAKARTSQVIFSAQPSPEDFAIASHSGARRVINLRTAEEMVRRVNFDERDTAREAGMQYVTIPFTSATLSLEQVEAFAAVFEQAVTADELVLLHCRSSDRAGGLWAVYLTLYQDVPLDRAIELGQQAGLHDEVMIGSVRRVAAAQ